MRDPIIINYPAAGAIVTAIIAIVMFAAGYAFGYDTRGWAENTRTVAAEPMTDPRCERDVWVVAIGDTVDDIIRRCYDGESLLAVKDEMRSLNPHIRSLGVIHPDDEITLPERGR